MQDVTRKLTIEEAKEIREKWIKSILAEGYVAMNHYGMQLGLAYGGGEAGGEFKKKIRKIQKEEKRKLSAEEVTIIYEDFEKKTKK